MRPADEEELRRLRARAYGPDADIHDDPAAVERLRQLEPHAAPAEPVPHPAPATPSGSSDAPRAGVPDPTLTAAASDLDAPHDQRRAHEPTEASGPARASAPSAERSTRRPWLVPAMWAASLGVTAVVAATAALAGAPPAPPFGAGDAEQVVVLEPDPDFAWPEMFGGRQYGAQGFEGARGRSTRTRWWMRRLRRRR